MKWTVVISFLLLVPTPDAQQRSRTKNNLKNSLIAPAEAQQSVPRPEVVAFFANIQNLLAGDKVEGLQDQLAPAVNLTLPSGENGLFSSSQSAALLSSLFGQSKVRSVRFSKISDDGTTPFAAGSIASVQRGSLQTNQVFVAVSRRDGKWLIVQFNVY